MKRFEVMAWLAGAALACGAARGDVVMLEGDSRLRGEVRSIDASGRIELASGFSGEPVHLRAGVVREVVFEHPASMDASFSSRVGLSNGDVLAAKVRSFDGRELVIDSPAVGTIAVPRSALRSLQLGIHRQNVVHAGFSEGEGWTPSGRNVDAWTFDDEVLRMYGGGNLARDVRLPSQFVVRFTLGWRSHPNFQFTFADPLLAAGTPCDRYLFRFAGNGIEVKREASEGRRQTTIVPLHRTTDAFPDNRLEVEIRVDRENAMLHLFLNGEPEGRYNDPVPGVPTGGGICISSNSGGDGDHELSDLRILDWDEESDRHRTEERGDAAKDSLIERHGDRFSGSLEAIDEAGGELVFRFRTDFLDAPVEMPDSEISTVFFGEDGSSAPPPAGHRVALSLRSEGFIQVTSCVFDGGTAKVAHPLLGELLFERPGILALERIGPREP